MIKVLHLVTCLNPGGIERWILNMLETIPRATCAMDVCCKGFELGKWAPNAQNLGAKVIWNPLTPEHFLFGIRLHRLLRDSGYDILHVHVGAYSGFPVWIGKRTNAKVVCSFHSSVFFPESWIMKLPGISKLRNIYARRSLLWALAKCDRIVCVSQSILQTLASLDKRIYSKSDVILHGTPIPEERTSEERKLFRESLGWHCETPLLIHVGRFESQKNPMGVLETYHKVLKHFDVARLVWVGDGPLRQFIEKKAATLSIQDKITFLGFRDDIMAILPQCDVLLMPSLSEGFGIAAIEAAAAGLPVVASNIPGLMEAVEDGRTGLLFEADDYDGMADAIIRLLSDPDFARSMGELGRQRVREDFSLEKMADEYIELYKKCLKQ